MKLPSNQQQAEAGEYFATYINSTLIVEVPIQEDPNVEEIADYIQSSGITDPIRVITLDLSMGVSMAVPRDLSVPNQRIEIIRASSLDELIALASHMIERSYKAKIDGRVPMSKKAKEYDDDANAILLRYHHLATSKR